MNFAHVHLILNHLPVVGFPVAIATLAFGLKLHSAVLQKFALALAVAFSLAALPVFFSGEPAEEVIENLPGVTESYIENHEDAAKISLVLVVVSGLSAAFAFWKMRGTNEHYGLLLLTLALLVVATISLGYTANLGGQIRHPEIRAQKG